MIKEAELPVPQEASSPELLHRVCTCNETLGICGHDGTGEAMYDYDEVSPDPECPTCVAMTPFWLCPVCLYRWDEVDT